MTDLTQNPLLAELKAAVHGYETAMTHQGKDRAISRLLDLVCLLMTEQHMPFRSILSEIEAAVYIPDTADEIRRKVCWEFGSADMEDSVPQADGTVYSYRRVRRIVNYMIGKGQGTSHVMLKVALIYSGELVARDYTAQAQTFLESVLTTGYDESTDYGVPAPTLRQ